MSNKPFDPARSMAEAKHEFGEHGGVNMSIEASTTFTVMAADTMPDIFAGEKAEAQMGAGKKSIAISVRLQPKSGTLTDEEIEAVGAKVIAGVEKATGGVLRG